MSSLTLISTLIIIIHIDNILPIVHKPINGQWSDWSSWTSCDKLCGPGKQRRYRLCDKPHPKYGGASCGGKSLEEMNCNEKDCPESMCNSIVIFLNPKLTMYYNMLS